MFSANLVQHTRILILAGFISDETYRKFFSIGLVFLSPGLMEMMRG